MQTIFSYSTSPSLNGPSHFCVFSHFDACNGLARNVIHYLKELKELGYQVLFVSTSQFLPEGGIEELRNLCHTVFLRENVGYDFGSYKAGIQYIQNSGIRPASLLLANDSVFGPIQPLKTIWDPAILEEFDLYGMTDSFQHGYHLQSYFLAYSRRLLESEEFRDFWNGVENFDPQQAGFKSTIIMNYEIGGTRNFLLKGYKIGVQFPFEEILKNRVQRLTQQLRSLKTPEGYDNEWDTRQLGPNLNASHRYWDTLIDMGHPFIKRELLTKNPTFTPINTWPTKVIEHAHFDPTMIVEVLIEANSLESIYNISINDAVAKLETLDDFMECDLNPVFHANAASLGLALTARFGFDDEFYLNGSPDVRLAVQQGLFPDGWTHFKAYGHREGRAYRFNRIP